MTERIEESDFIAWLRDLFADTDAASMFRWVVVVWAIAAVALIVLDRLGSRLLGRSKPIAQAPPERARTWRWGRSLPPATFARTTVGTLGDPIGRPPSTTANPSIPLSTRPAIGPAPVAPNEEHWRGSAEPAAPRFGFENESNLDGGQPPERYNPIAGRVEQLVRDEETGDVWWPEDAPDLLVFVGPADEPDRSAEHDTIDLVNEVSPA